MPLCAHFAHFELLPNSLPRAAASTAPNNLPPALSSPPVPLSTHVQTNTHTPPSSSPPHVTTRLEARVGLADTGRLVNPLPAPMGSHHDCKLSQTRRGQHRDEAAHTHPDLAVSFSTAGAWKRAEVWCFLSRFFPPLPLFSVSTDRISAAVN